VQNVGTHRGSGSYTVRCDWLVDDSISQETRLAESEEADNRRKALGEALCVLNERERRIFEARRLADEPITLEELADEFGVSRGRVRQIEGRAFEKVQKAVKNRILLSAPRNVEAKLRCVSSDVQCSFSLNGAFVNSSINIFPRSTHISWTRRHRNPSKNENHAAVAVKRRRTSGSHSGIRPHWTATTGRGQMFGIKTALVGFGMLVGLSTVAQAYDERFGNGGTWVTIPDSSTDASVGSRQSVYHPGILDNAGTGKASRLVASSRGKHLRTKALNSDR
jgi:hypothetical protein